MACYINCFIECLYCNSLVEHQGKEHNCPVAQVDKVVGVTDYFKVCERCQLLLKVIFLDQRQWQFVSCKLCLPYFCSVKWPIRMLLHFSAFGCAIAK